MIDKDNEIVSIQANPFLMGRKDYSSVERRILHIAISSINPHLLRSQKYDKDFYPIHIPASKIVKMLGTSGYYSSLKEICNKMMKKTVVVQDTGKEFDIVTVFSRIKFSSEKGLDIFFNPDMKPYILDLAETQYTKIPLMYVLKLDSAYAIAILELLMQYRNVYGNPKVRRIKIDELRSYMGVDDKKAYSLMSNFRKFVLDKPIKELNQKLGQYIQVEYTPIKQGKRVTDIEFYFYIKSEMQSLPNSLSHASDNLRNRLSHYGFSEKVQELLLKKCKGSEKELLRRLDFVEKRAKEGKPKSNLSGFIRKGIEENWAGAPNPIELSQLQKNLDRITEDFEAKTAIEPQNEKPFDTSDALGAAKLQSVKKDLLEGHLSLTSINLLEFHNMTPKRFFELYMSK